MCAAELTWYTLKVYNWILMKRTWWNWHAVPGTAYWNMGHTAGTLRKIGIYLMLRNNCHIDVPWNISKIFYRISFFFCSTHGFDIELYNILYSILWKLYIQRIGVHDWHIGIFWLIQDFVLKSWNMHYFSFQPWLMILWWKININSAYIQTWKNGQHFANNIFKWVFL